MATDEKCKKNWVVWGVRGHPRSLETLPFDRAHMTSYSTLIESIRLSCTVLSYNAFLVESDQFSPTPPALVASVGDDPVRISP